MALKAFIPKLRNCFIMHRHKEERKSRGESWGVLMRQKSPFVSLSSYQRNLWASFLPLLVKNSPCGNDWNRVQFLQFCYGIASRCGDQLASQEAVFGVRIVIENGFFFLFFGYLFSLFFSVNAFLTLSSAELKNSKNC